MVEKMAGKDIRRDAKYYAGERYTGEPTHHIGYGMNNSRKSYTYCS